MHVDCSPITKILPAKFHADDAAQNLEAETSGLTKEADDVAQNLEVEPSGSAQNVEAETSGLSKEANDAAQNLEVEPSGWAQNLEVHMVDHSYFENCTSASNVEMCCSAYDVDAFSFDSSGIVTTPSAQGEISVIGNCLL